MSKYQIDEKNHLYPFCIVWSPIPVVTWCLPFIGHMGICNSKGEIHDFAIPYEITVNEFAFGNPTKYLQLDPKKIIKREKNSIKSYEEIWDESIERVKDQYSNHFYNFFGDNCHNFVAKCLDEMNYDNRMNYYIVELGWKLFFSKSFVGGRSGQIKTFLGFFIMALITIVYLILIKFMILNKL
eukprot:gene10189-2608_t